MSVGFCRPVQPELGVIIWLVPCFLGVLNRHLFGRLSSSCLFCQLLRHFWCGRFRSHNRVILVQGQGGSLDPRFASVSACSFPMMRVSYRVHSPLILQPRCRKIFISFRQACTYSLPAVGPPIRALSAVWLSTQGQVILSSVQPSTWARSPSCIAWVLPSSMSLLVPI